MIAMFQIPNKFFDQPMAASPTSTATTGKNLGRISGYSARRLSRRRPR